MPWTLPLGVCTPSATLEDNFAEYISTKNVQTLSPSKSRLGIYPREISTYVHIIRSESISLVPTNANTVLGSGDTSVNKIDSNCRPHEI